MAAYLCITTAGAQSSVTSIQSCLSLDPDGYIAMSAAALADQPTLQDIFAIPLAEDMVQMWSLGFGLPMTCFLSAWGFGVVLNFLRDTKHY